MIVVARFETRNFVFEGIGTTHDEAKTALERGWERHVVQYDAEPGYLAEFAEDIAYVIYLPGSCLRDGERIA